MNGCAVVARSQLAHARVLAESIREHHAGASVAVLVVDDRAGEVGAGEPFDVVRLDELGIEARLLRLVAFLLPRDSLARALKPWLVRTLLQQGLEDVLCLDPESWVLAPLRDLEERMREERTLLLPRPDIDRPLPVVEPGEPPLADGGCDPGFLWASQASRPFLDWWADELVRSPTPAPDSRFLDLALSLEGAELLRDPTVGLAWWNAPGRELRREDGTVLVEGRPVRVARFPRPTRGEPPELASLRADHELALRARGLDEAEAEPYGWGALPDGTPIDSRMRRIYRRVAADLGGATDALPDPFDPDDPEAFVRWLAESPNGRGVSRYLLTLRQERMTVEARFPRVPGEDAEAYVAWAREHGREEGIPPRLADVARGGDSSPGDLPIGNPDLHGLNVVGPFGRGHGLAEAGRQLVSALREAGVPLATALSTPKGNPGPVPFAEDGLGALRYDTNLLCVNVNEIVAFAEAFPASLLEGRYTIGFWWWEVSELPDELLEAFDRVDEVWAGSDYVRDAFARYTAKPVVSMPFPATFSLVEPPARAELGLPDGFMFLFVFDFHSRLERKNTVGLVEAFERAFAPGEGPVLVVKSIHGDRELADLERLRLAAGDRPDIVLLDGFVPERTRAGLVATCDCYVSLHRSEGLGLTIAEAMAYGKPVIATAYSGNMSFTSDENAFLVPYSMTRVPPTCPLYPHGAPWADPDADAAAALMRTVYEDERRRARVAERGARDVRELLAPARAARAMAARLAEIRAA